MRRECRERFSRHRGLAIPICITARAWRTCRDACQDRWLAISFEIGGRENVPGIPGACATRNFAYLVRGPCPNPYPITSYGLWDAILDQNITLLHDNETHQMCNMVRVLFLLLMCQVSVKYSRDEWCHALYLYAFNPQCSSCYRFARYSGICCSLIR